MKCDVVRIEIKFCVSLTLSSGFKTFLNTRLVWMYTNYSSPWQWYRTIYACVSTALCWTLAAFWVPLYFYTVCRIPWTWDHPVARPLPRHRTAQTQNKRTQTSMLKVGFEPTISVPEWANKVDVLDRAGTVIGCRTITPHKIVFVTLLTNKRQCIVCNTETF
jgi:hypothetical protein